MNIEAKIAKIMANDAVSCNLQSLILILDKFNFTKKFKVITIAGTNGKGTTVAMLEELLTLNNKRVISHTSPHVLKFNERIALNKNPISDSALFKLLEELEELTKQYRLSYYQIAFLCACMYCQKVQIDYLILEVGIGGRLDAANIIDADITAITNIDFDHCNILGNTLDKIGIEKAGISREKVPLFLGSKMPKSVYQQANLSKAIIHEKKYNHNDKECFIDSYNIAMGIADCLFDKKQIAHIPKLEHIKANARFMLIKSDQFNDSYIVVDVAHNPASTRYLFKLLNSKFNYKQIKYEAVFGILANKNIKEILAIAKNYIYQWHVVDLKYLDSRAMSIEQVKQEFKDQHITKVDYRESLDVIYSPKKDTLRVIFGSFVLAGEFIKGYEKYNS